MNTLRPPRGLTPRAAVADAGASSAYLAVALRCRDLRRAGSGDTSGRSMPRGVNTRNPPRVTFLRQNRPCRRFGMIHGPGDASQPARRGQQTRDDETGGQPLAPPSAGVGRSGYQATPALPMGRVSRRSDGRGVSMVRAARRPSPDRKRARLRSEPTPRSQSAPDDLLVSGKADC